MHPMESHLYSGLDLRKDQRDICPGPKLQGIHEKRTIHLFIYKARIIYFLVDLKVAEPGMWYMGSVTSVM